MTWSVVVDGKPIRVESLRLRRSLEDTHSSAQLVVPDNLMALRGQRATLHDSESRRLTGVIEEVTGTWHDGYSLQIRSLTCRLDVWQSHRNELIRGRTHADVAAVLARKVDLSIAPGRPDRAISRFRLKRGESLQSALQRLASVGAWVLTDDSQGRLRMFQLHAPVRPTALWQPNGSPLLDVSELRKSIADWRDVVYVRGQRVAVAADEGDPGAGQISTRAQGTTFPERPSQLVLSSGSAVSTASAQLRAHWESLRRVGMSVSVTAELATWAAEPGDIVRVEDHANGLDAVLVVQSMEGTVSATSARFTAHLVPPFVYQIAGPATPEAA